MISFHVLGTLDLRGPDGRHLASPLSGAKRLALLAFLVLGARRGLHRRDTLLGLFWPDSEQSRARNALSNMLHQIRRSLGPGVLVTRGQEQVGVAEGGVWCDARAFQGALDEGRLTDALELYRGDLLKGLFVSDASPEFDHWLAAERARLRGRAAEAARALDEAAEQAGNASEAIRWARRAVAFDPYDERGARRLIALLDRTGDRAGALKVYEELAELLAREFEAEPSSETRAVIEGVRHRSGAFGGRSGPEAGGSAPDPGDGDRRAAAGASTAAGGNEVEGRGRVSPHCVAVLPFANLSGTPDAEPFAEGLHHDLLTELSQSPALSVIARTSVLRYRETELGIPDIARALGAGTIVEGGVRIEGGRVRLNVQVIDARSGVQRWAERYDRELSAGGLFDLQGDLSREIAQALRGELTTGDRRPRAAGERTADLEAYRLSVQGRALLDQRAPAAIYRSIDYFQRTIERDSTYALAWSGLADALSLLEFYDHPPPPATPGPMQAAVRAVELGPGLGQAHASLGIIRSIRQEATPALSELRKAIELAPSHAEAHAWLGWVQLLRGYPTEALSAAARAVTLDPLAPAFRAYLAESHLANGGTREALREAVRARQIQPEYGLAHYIEGLILHHLHRLPEAEAALQTALGLVPPWGVPSHAEIHATIAVTRAAAGDDGAARAHLASIDGTAHPFSRGLALAALGEVDQAFSAFEAVRQWGSFSTDHLRYFFPAVLGPLRTDGRYRRLLTEVDRQWGRKGDAM